MPNARIFCESPHFTVVATCECLAQRRSASITASALSSKTSPLGGGWDFFALFLWWDSYWAQTDQGSPRRISRWTAGVPPLIYAIPLRVFTITGGGHHDSPCDLPAVVRGGPAPNQSFGSAVGGTTALLGLPDI